MRIISVIIAFALALGMFACMAEGEAWDCPYCGKKGIVFNFCGECGTARPAKETPQEWLCRDCRVQNTGNFCYNCGKPRTAVAAETAAAAPQVTITAQAGDYVSFGAYPQTGAGNDSTPIEWLVLEVRDGRLLLISRLGLDVQQYNTDECEVSWETCSLRGWLNGAFLNAAFTSAEQAAIVTNDTDNSASQGSTAWGSRSCENTSDRVFLLSCAEALTYLGTECAAVPSGYALGKGAYTPAPGQPGYWWLRSPGLNQVSASVVPPTGDVVSMEAFTRSNIVRPAIWVKADQVNGASRSVSAPAPTAAAQVPGNYSVTYMLDTRTEYFPWAAQYVLGYNAKISSGVLGGEPVTYQEIADSIPEDLMRALTCYTTGDRITNYPVPDRNGKRGAWLTAEGKKLPEVMDCRNYVVYAVYTDTLLEFIANANVEGFTDQEKALAAILSEFLSGINLPVFSASAADIDSLMGDASDILAEAADSFEVNRTDGNYIRYYDEHGTEIFPYAMALAEEIAVSRAQEQLGVTPEQYAAYAAVNGAQVKQLLAAEVEKLYSTMYETALNSGNLDMLRHFAETGSAVTPYPVPEKEGYTGSWSPAPPEIMDNQQYNVFAVYTRK